MSKYERIPVRPGRYIFHPDLDGVVWFMTDQDSAPAHVKIDDEGNVSATINCVPMQVDSLRGEWEYIGPWEDLDE